MTTLDYNREPNLNVDQQNSALKPMEVCQMKENEWIFREGDIPRGIYMVKSGSVKIVVNRPLTRGRTSSSEFITKVVGPGEFFGFKSPIKSTRYNIHAKTLKPSEIHIFAKDSIEEVMRGPDSVLKMVLQQITNDLESFEMNTQLHYLASVQERIAYQLSLLGDKFGVETASGISLNLRLTRNELAQLAGTINESLSRHLTELKNEGLIDINGREIIIKDKEALKKRSGNFK